MDMTIAKVDRTIEEIDTGAIPIRHSSMLNPRGIAGLNDTMARKSNSHLSQTILPDR